MTDATTEAPGPWDAIPLERRLIWTAADLRSRGQLHPAEAVEEAAATLRALAAERDALLKERNALRAAFGVIGAVIDRQRAEVRNG
jgi:hypothetical protein